jgi:site-specific DNA recombinase
LRTGIYVRVSTDEQAKEGFSIRAQQDKLKDYIRIKEWELHDVYIDDGISGKNITDRPEVNRLISDVVKGNVKNVLVFKIDRLTRSTKDLISLMDLFNEKKCAFNSLMESIDTHTPSGRMFIKIIGIFAEFERENIIERVTVALEKKAREGYILSSFNTVPYGYRREIGQREITVNAEEAKTVREIFNLYLHKHKSYNAIAIELNLRGILSSGNSKWGSYTVSYILSNPIYMGKVRYCLHDKERYFESDGRHEAIISEEIFLEVQSKIGKMKKNRKRPREDNYYCGTLMCAECGHKMTTRGQYRQTEDNEAYYGSYLCLGKKYVGCKTGTLSHKKVDIAFREYIERYADFDEISKEGIELQEPQEDTTALKGEYETRLAGLLKKEKDITALYVGDRIDFEQYSHMLEAIRADKNKYADKIFELDGEEQLNTAFQKEDILSNFKANWDELTNLERMQFLQTYIQAVYVRREEDRQIKVKRLEFYKK